MRLGGPRAARPGAGPDPDRQRGRARDSGQAASETCRPLGPGPGEDQPEEQNGQRRGDRDRRPGTQLHREHRHEPDRGPEQQDRKTPAEGDHPRPGARHPGRDPGESRADEVRQRQPDAETQEHRIDLDTAPREREADRRAEERRRARSRQQRRENASEEMARDAVGLPAARLDGDVRHRAGQADLEQAEEIGGKQAHDDRHEDEEHRLLELDPPAHRFSGEA